MYIRVTALVRHASPRRSAHLHVIGKTSQIARVTSLGVGCCRIRHPLLPPQLYGTSAVKGTLELMWAQMEVWVGVASHRGFTQ
eukprot:1875931-Amphidinium_carterae.1